MEKYIDLLISDPFKFLIGALTFGVFYVFKSYDKRIGKNLTEHSRRMNKINDETKETAFKIENVKNEFLKSNNQLSIDIQTLKSEIKEVQRQINLEVRGMVTIVSSQSTFSEKLIKYDKQLNELKENYGKVILLEEKMNRMDNNQDDIVKSIYDIADKIGKIKSEK
jgi:uncharacterized protein YpuA (DUF1002 family)